jgi:hypothetical protein
MTDLKKETKQGEQQPVNGCRTDVLLSKGPMGEISVCSAGCLHIDTPAVSIRLTEPDFRMLVRMFSTAATKLTTMRNTAVH